MTQVSVAPESFEMVFYDAAVIGEVVAEVADSYPTATLPCP